MVPDPWKLMRWAEEQAGALDLSPAAAHTLLVLAVHADLHTGETRLGVHAIVERTRRGKTTIHPALRELTDHGLISRRRRGPGRSALTYLAAPWFKISARPEVTRDGDDLHPSGGLDLHPSGRKTSTRPEIDVQGDGQEGLTDPYPNPPPRGRGPLSREQPERESSLTRFTGVVR